MEALRYVTRAEDGRVDPTRLRESVLTTLGLDAVEDLVSWIERASKAEVASLAPVIVHVADERDAGAMEIVDGAVSALRTQVEASLRRLGRATGHGPAPEVVLWGGLLADGGPLRTRVEAALSAIGIETGTRTLDPPMGAARLALAVRPG
jgi:N-acetylglucosamine kinase-like BadF-type ATPase